MWILMGPPNEMNEGGGASRCLHSIEFCFSFSLLLSIVVVGNYVSGILSRLCLIRREPYTDIQDKADLPYLAPRVFSGERFAQVRYQI